MTRKTHISGHSCSCFLLVFRGLLVGENLVNPLSGTRSYFFDQILPLPVSFFPRKPFNILVHFCKLSCLRMVPPLQFLVFCENRLCRNLKTNKVKYLKVYLERKLHKESIKIARLFCYQFAENKTGYLLYGPIFFLKISVTSYY